MPPLGIIHITAAYSNAVLVAVLPHISNFAKKLDLPIHLPITKSQVKIFIPNWIQGEVGGGIVLSNHYQFGFDMGYVTVFHNLTNNPFITDGSREEFRKFAGKDNMTLDDAVEFSKNIMVKLGYSPQELHADTPPFSTQNSFTMNSGEHIPYCEVVWDNEKTTTNNRDILSMDFQIDMERKQLVGMTLIGNPFEHTNPYVSVKPELESDYKRRMHNIHVGMFVDTNAPVILSH
jgi:hypothetical protein